MACDTQSGQLLALALRDAFHSVKRTFQSERALKCLAGPRCACVARRASRALFPTTGCRPRSRAPPGSAWRRSARRFLAMSPARRRRHRRRVSGNRIGQEERPAADRRGARRVPIAPCDTGHRQARPAGAQRPFHFGADGVGRRFCRLRQPACDATDDPYPSRRRRARARDDLGAHDRRAGGRQGARRQARQPEFAARRPAGGARTARQARTDLSNAHAADVLPYIEAARAAGCSSLGELARALTARGIRTPAGGLEWRAAQVSRVLARATPQS